MVEGVGEQSLVPRLATAPDLLRSLFRLVAFSTARECPIVTSDGDWSTSRRGDYKPPTRRSDMVACVPTGPLKTLCQERPFLFSIINFLCYPVVDFDIAFHARAKPYVKIHYGML